MARARWWAIVMNPFDSYMLNKVRRLKDVRTRFAATGEKAVLVKTRNGRDARCPLCGGCGGVWIERILNGESASMLAEDAQLGKL